jgi:hypothetical protein
MSPRLPPELITRASLRGREYAWLLQDIPAVVEAARKANLINIGGQLQFRLPGATCECYWVKVDTCEVVPATLTWSQRVQESAEEALRQLEALKSRFDFLAEGERDFATHLEEARAAGANPIEHMCFVWYVESEGEAEQSASGG